MMKSDLMVHAKDDKGKSDFAANLGWKTTTCNDFLGSILVIKLPRLQFIPQNAILGFSQSISVFK